MRQCSLCFGGLVTLMSQSQKECLAQDFKKIFLGGGGMLSAFCLSKDLSYVSVWHN